MVQFFIENRNLVNLNQTFKMKFIKFKNFYNYNFEYEKKIHSNITVSQFCTFNELKGK